METNKKHKLYAYTFPTYHKKGWIKVGDTTKTIEERVKEQYGTSNPEKYKILKEWDIGNYRDYDIHKILKQLGYIRINKKREWFKCTIKDVDTAVNMLINGIARQNSFQPRIEQLDAINQAFDYYKNGGDSFLWNAKMRFGKTLASYWLMKKLKAKVTLILTYKPAVIDSWENDLNNHIDFENYSFYNLLDWDSKSNVEEYSVFFGSFQDLLGKNNNQIKNKWKNLLKYHIDLLIVDEVHFGAESTRAKEMLEKISFTNRLDMSGTPIKALMSGIYTEEQIYTWSYINEQEKKQEEIKSNSGKEIYKWLPEMHYYSFEIDKSVLDKMQNFSEKEYFTLNKFFSSDDGIVLNNASAVERWLDILAEEESRVFYSPFNNNFMVNKLNHLFWVLDTVNSVKALCQLLKNHWYFKKYHCIIAADNNDGLGSDTLDIVKTAIRTNQKTITLSCGKLNTGVSVPYWNAVFMLNDTKAVETYTQTIFRVQTSNIKEKKEHCFVFDFNPDRMLEMIYNYCEVIAKKNDTTINTLRKYLETIKVLSYSGNSLKEININDIIETGIKPETAIKKFSSERLINVHNCNKDIIDIINNIVPAKGAKIQKIISKNDIKGKTFDITNINKHREKIDDEIIKNIKAKAMTVIQRLPSFLFNCNEKPESCSDIINNYCPDRFYEDVEIHVEDFRMMLMYNFINENLLNRAIEAFKYYENSFNNIENRIEALKHLYSPAADEVYTPIELVNEVLNKMPEEIWSDPNKTFCDPCVKEGAWTAAIFIKLMKGLSTIIKDENERKNHIIKNMIFGFTNNRRSQKIANKVLYNDIDFKGKIFIKDILNEDIKMKFDVIVGNPPYKNGLHLQFLELAINHSNNEVVFIQPAGWLINEKNIDSNTKEKKMLRKIENKIKSIELKNPNIIWKEAHFATPVAIIHLNINLNQTNFIYKSLNNQEFNCKLNELSKHGNSNIYKTLKSKILTYIENNSSLDEYIHFQEKPKKGKWYIVFSGIRGNVDYKSEKFFSDNFFSFVPKNYIPTKDFGKMKHPKIYEFDTLEEATNCLYYIKSKFARFCLSIYKINTHNNRKEFTSVPWFNFKKNVDMQIKEKLNLTKEENEFIEKIIPNY